MSTKSGAQRWLARFSPVYGGSRQRLIMHQNWRVRWPVTRSTVARPEQLKHAVYVLRTSDKWIKMMGEQQKNSWFHVVVTQKQNNVEIGSCGFRRGTACPWYGLRFKTLAPVGWNRGSDCSVPRGTGWPADAVAHEGQLSSSQKL